MLCHCTVWTGASKICNRLPAFPLGFRLEQSGKSFRKKSICAENSALAGVCCRSQTALRIFLTV